MRHLVLTAAVVAATIPATASAQASTAFADGPQVSLSYAMTAPTPSDLSRGQKALLAGQFERAQRLLTPLADGPVYDGAPILTAFADLGAGDVAKARRRFAGIVDRGPLNVVARQGLGLAFVAEGRPTEARAELATLEAQRERCGSGCRRAESLDRAIASLRRAIG